MFKIKEHCNTCGETFYFYDATSWASSKCKNWGKNCEYSPELNLQNKIKYESSYEKSITNGSLRSSRSISNTTPIKPLVKKEPIKSINNSYSSYDEAHKRNRLLEEENDRLRKQRDYNSSNDLTNMLILNQLLHNNSSIQPTSTSHFSGNGGEFSGGGASGSFDEVDKCASNNSTIQTEQESCRTSSYSSSDDNSTRSSYSSSSSDSYSSSSSSSSSDSYSSSSDSSSSSSSYD